MMEIYVHNFIDLSSRICTRCQENYCLIAFSNAGRGYCTEINKLLTEVHNAALVSPKTKSDYTDGIAYG